MTKYVIFNADDLGASSGVNRGIVEAHLNGPVTSASLTVTGHAPTDAAARVRDHPDLAVGLHFDVWGEDERDFDMDDAAAVRDEFHRQVDLFEHLLGYLPTHVDSHRHAHRPMARRELFVELVAPLGVPLRFDGKVRYVGDFYAQWEWMVTDLSHVSVPALQQILRDRIIDGWSEVACHPGYVSSDYQAVYLEEREVELRSLTDPLISQTVREEGIQLASYREAASTLA